MKIKQIASKLLECNSPDELKQTLENYYNRKFAGKKIYSQFVFNNKQNKKNIFITDKTCKLINNLSLMNFKAGNYAPDLIFNSSIEIEPITYTINSIKVDFMFYHAPAYEFVNNKYESQLFNCFLRDTTVEEVKKKATNGDSTRVSFIKNIIVSLDTIEFPEAFIGMEFCTLVDYCETSLLEVSDFFKDSITNEKNINIKEVLNNQQDNAFLQLLPKNKDIKIGSNLIKLLNIDINKEYIGFSLIVDENNNNKISVFKTDNPLHGFKVNDGSKINNNKLYDKLVKFFPPLSRIYVKSYIPFVDFCDENEYYYYYLENENKKEVVKKRTSKKLQGTSDIKKNLTMLV